MDDLDYAELAAKDRKYLWHPFTQMRDWCAGEPMIVARGEGRKLIDVNGREYWDGVSSLWVNVHGHREPALDEALREQLGKIAHSTMLGLANVPAILLAEKLVELTPDGLTRVFYSDSGSESVEIALKMAYQYWRHLGDHRRTTFVKMAEAYHGDTIGSVSAGGMEQFHAAFRDLLFPTFTCPYPHPFRFGGTAAACRDHCLDELEVILREHGGDVAGVILEPLVQGAAGMIVSPPGFLRGVAALCRKYNVLLLVDEVATGFGRTGKMFACEHEDVCPDILMTAKGLTGGYLPLAATITSEAVYSAFLGDYAEQKTFFHGHSYTGNQLACAAALANIRLFAERDLVADAARKGALVADWLAPLRAYPHVGDVRGRGMMFGIEVMRDPAAHEDYDWRERMGVQVCNRAVELGMFIRPLGNVVVFMPPLGSTDDELRTMVDILVQAVGDITGRP